MWSFVTIRTTFEDLQYVPFLKKFELTNESPVFGSVSLYQVLGADESTNWIAGTALKPS